MADSDRSARPDVTAGDINFFQLVELLNRREEGVRFKASASLGFPGRDLVRVGKDNKGRHELEVAFLGLHGSQSPLPGYYLDPLAWEQAQGEQKLGRFLDFFHHRQLILLHRIWRKYRCHVRVRDDGEDRISRLLLALLGLGGEAVRESLPLSHARLFSCLGLLSSPCRSPEVVARLVAHCFTLAAVAVCPWQRRQVAIAREQQNRLGRVCATLGGDLVIGARVNDCAGKFLLKIDGLSLERLRGFLPGGEQFQPLVRFVSFILRDQLAWDLQLGFGQGEARGLRLGEPQGTYLGRDSFLGQPSGEPFITLCVQE